MIFVLVGAVAVGLALAPVAQRLVPSSRGSLDAGPIETYIGTAFAIAFMVLVFGGAAYGIVDAISAH
ncbi:MAG: hypothetical protein ACJ75S_04030 [Solirubrobacterales bacterium]